MNTRTNSRRPARRQAGMTLIEVLVALLIFSLGMLGMVGMQAMAAKYSIDAEDRSRAALMANEIVAQMWLAKTVSLPTATVTAWTTRLQNAQVSGLPNATGSITTATVDGVVVATVAITWHSPARKSTDPDATYMTQVSMP